MVNPGAAKLLIVDDDTSIIQALKRLLRSEGLTVVGAKDPREALQKMRTTDFNLVISDLKMPGMNGIEFLSIAAEIFPRTSQALLSGHAELTDLADAIDQCQIEHFFPKPWDPQEFKTKTVQMMAENEYQRKRQAAGVENEELTNDTKMLQRFLLPEAFNSDTVSCDYIFHSSDSLGGDGLGYHRVDDKLCFYQFDVSGSGLSATMQAFSLHGRLAQGNYADPAQLLLDTNRDYPFLHDPERYVRLICGCLDINSGELIMSRAGYPNPILIGRPRMFAEDSGKPIGVVKDPEYANVELTMVAGDKLIVFSDGMAAEEDDNLLELLDTCRDDNIALLKQVLEGWRNTLHISDDIAVLLLERKAEAPH